MLFRLRLFYFCAIEAQSHKALESVHLVTSLYLWLARRIAQSHKMDQYKKYLKLAKELRSLKETKVSKNHYHVSPLVRVLINFQSKAPYC